MVRHGCAAPARCGQAHLLADRRAPGPLARRQRLADHGDRRMPAIVAGVEQPALHRRDPQRRRRAERGDDVRRGHRGLAIGGTHREGGATVAAGQRRPEQHALDGGVVGQPRLRVAEDAVAGLPGRETLGRRGQLDLQQPRRVVAGIERHDAAGDHARQHADEHQDRHGGHLRDDHGAGEPPLAAGAGPGAVLDHLADVGAHGPQRHHGAERDHRHGDERAGAGDGHGVHLPHPPERHVVGHVGLGPPGDRVEPPGRRGGADDAAGQAQQAAFPEALRDEPRRRGAERQPHRGFADAFVGARGEQRGDVDQREQQDQPGRHVEADEDERPFVADLRRREGFHGGAVHRRRQPGRIRRPASAAVDQVPQQRRGFGGGLRLRRVRGEPAEERERLLPGRRGEDGRRERQPRILGDREAEAGRHDPDHPRGDAVERDDLARGRPGWPRTAVPRSGATGRRPAPRRAARPTPSASARAAPASAPRRTGRAR